EIQTEASSTEENIDKIQEEEEMSSESSNAADAAGIPNQGAVSGEQKRSEIQPKSSSTEKEEPVFKISYSGENRTRTVLAPSDVRLHRETSLDMLLEKKRDTVERYLKKEDKFNEVLQKDEKDTVNQALSHLNSLLSDLQDLDEHLRLQESYAENFEKNKQLVNDIRSKILLKRFQYCKNFVTSGKLTEDNANQVISMLDKLSQECKRSRNCLKITWYVLADSISRQKLLETRILTEREIKNLKNEILDRFTAAPALA